MLLDKVMEIRESVTKIGTFKKSDCLFEGAGIVITDSDGILEDTNYKLVKTLHAYELSSLIFTLKDIFSSKIDYFSKFEFYGRLGETAVTYLQNNPDTELVLIAVLDEAIAIAKEMEG